MGEDEDSRDLFLAELARHKQLPIQAWMPHAVLCVAYGLLFVGDSIRLIAGEMLCARLDEDGQSEDNKEV